MEIERLRTQLIASVHPDAIEELQLEGLQPALYINSNYLVEVCTFLRDDDNCFFDFLADVAAVDYFPENFFEVVYQLTSMPFQKQLTLKVRISAERDGEILPEVPSVSAVWKTAEWHEREAFDLMGIFFDGNPDLRRILMPDDWEGFPLRKDYQDPEKYHGISIN